MMRQYRELKRRYPDYLLLFRLGDFYETFFEDAEVAARLLQITLTSRQGAPMAGIPHHAADGYIARLVRAGRKIAISEQLEAPDKAKKLLKRDVVRIMTPGTITDTAYLAGAANNFLLTVVRGREARGVALLDVSTGDFWVGEDGAREDAVLAAALLRRPAEILIPARTREDRALLARLEASGATLTFAEPARRARRRALLRPMGDLERLTSRAALGQAHARDLVGLRACLAPLGEIRETCRGVEASLLAAAAADLADLEPLRALLETALVDEPPLGLHDGGIIRESWNDALGAIVREAREARDWIAGLEERERVRTGIPSLRVRFNRVFGYGIEVTHAHTARVPDGYIRRQTLTGAERYVTAELKEYEAKVLGADERRRRLEHELFEEVRRQVGAQAAELITTARALARLDALASLSEIAHARGHVRPVVDRGDGLSIVGGRHPVLQAHPGVVVTPNDVAQDGLAPIVILTGPNMSGKSVYLRQTAHIVILAQMGAFVPAREARIGVIDRIFTRVGAQDNLARGQSTFLVEMVETATIRNNVTPRSLVLLDEVGRGTSTFDGLGIAWAVVDALHERGQGAKGLLASHFHELPRLAGRLPGVRNFHVAVREWNDEIIFLHKVLPGATDRSYGIQVARLAGLRPEVIARAKALLTELEEAGQVRADARDAVQLGLFTPAAPDPIATELAALDLAHVTPLEALNLLHKWQQRTVDAGSARPACAAGMRSRSATDARGEPERVGPPEVPEAP